MKTQIIFYIGWDILFIGQLYLFSRFDRMILIFAKRSMEFNYTLWFQIGWMIIIGGILTILVYKGKQFQERRKSAILELIVIGIPTAYIATAIAIPYSLASLAGENISCYVPFWLSYSTTARLASGIVLGYEIFIFFMRITKKQNDDISEIHQEEA